MKITGFRTFDFAPDYWFGIPDETMMVPSVEPVILTRPGTFATFGVPIVSEIVIAGELGYKGALTYEAAFLNAFKRLDIMNPAPGELRALRNDLVAIKIQAMIRVPRFNDVEGVISVKPVHFVIASPIWLAVGYSVGSGGFT